MEALNNGLTVFLILWPLAVMLLVWMGGNRNARWIALLGTIVQLAGTLHALYYFDFTQDAVEHFSYDVTWLAQFDINFHVGMDGISLMMVLLTNMLLPLIMLSSFGMNYPRPRLFYCMALLMQSALVGVFTAMDIFLYYIFWELALIPIYLIILVYGSANRVKVTFKFFLYTLFGSLLMLVAVILWKWWAAPGTPFTADQQAWLFWPFLLAFAIKMPIWPLHTWQPDTYTTAPPQGTMLLSGIMLKMGVYSVIRWILPYMPDALANWSQLIIGLAVIGIVYGAWIAITQKDIKRLFAYSSLSHVGLIAAGIFAAAFMASTGAGISVKGLQGAMVQMLAHGVNIVGLFFVAQIIFDRVRTHNIPEMGGIINSAPVFGTFFLVILLGSVALPLTNGFIGEFLLLNAVYDYNAWMAAAAGLTIIFSAVYMLRAYQRSMLGEVNPNMPSFADLQLSEAVVMIAIAALVIFMGVYPKPFLDMTDASVQGILETMEANKIIR